MIDITRIIKKSISIATVGYSLTGLFLVNNAYAETNASFKSNDLGPFAAFSAFTQIGKYTYFLGETEIGAKHQKLATTFTTFAGWNKEHGFKATLQYLRQKPDVSFFDKTRSIWIQQASLGLEYLYVFNNVFQFNASGYYGYIPEESVTIKNSTTINDIFGANTVVQDSNSDIEIGRISRGHQFGGWLGLSYTPFRDTLLRGKVVCDALNRDLKYSAYYDDNGQVHSRDNTLYSCGLGATVQFPIYSGFSFRFDVDYNQLNQRYNPELTWTPDFVDNMRFSLGGKIEKAGYEGDNSGFYNYYVKMFYEF